jgi:hypothetical protein
MIIYSQIFDEEPPEEGDIFKIIDITDMIDMRWGKCKYITLEKLNISKKANDDY